MQKIGYIATRHIVHTLPQYEKMMQGIQTEFQSEIDEVNALNTQLQETIAELTSENSGLSVAQKQELGNKHNGLANEHKTKSEALNQAVKERKQEEDTKLLQLVQEAINKVAEEDGYDMILEIQAVCFGKPEDNISEKVFNILKEM